MNEQANDYHFGFPENDVIAIVTRTRETQGAAGARVQSYQNRIEFDSFASSGVGGLMY